MSQWQQEVPWRSVRGEVTDPRLRGYDQNSYIARRLDGQELLASLTEMSQELKFLDIKLQHDLLEICGINGQIPEWIPLAPSSQTVMNGVLPSLYPYAVRYLDILVELGQCKLAFRPEGQQGMESAKRMGQVEDCLWLYTC